MRAAFKDDTGLVLLPPPATPIKAMVNAATRASGNTAAFIEWVTREYWGLDEAPQSYMDAVGEAKMAECKLGDTVRLKSGGPTMTVIRVGDIEGTPTVWCTWFPGANEKKQASFPPEALELV